MTRRSGMSLTEVLVALFIMALGTIAILTLFPLGALNMAQALKDDRTSQAAIQADNFMRMYWKQNLCEPLQAAIGTGLSNGSTLDVNLATGFVDPSGTAINIAGSTAAQPSLLHLNPTDTGTGSYAVVIDPMGFVARSAGALDQTWIASLNSTSLLRVNLNLPGSSNTSQAFRNCTALDGLGYSTSGAALLNASSGTIDRETRYNWLWVLQQQNIGLTNFTSNNQTTTVVSTSTPVLMTVVVFDRRANQFVPTNAEQVFTPSVCQVGSNLVSFDSTLGAVPLVQKGDWLMDATVAHLDCNLTVYNPIPPNTPPVAFSPPPPAKATILSSPISYVRNANFYRIVSVTQNGTSTDIELQTPLPPDTCTTSVQQILPRQSSVSTFNLPTITIQPANRQFVVLTGVSEVFQRPVLSFP